MKPFYIILNFCLLLFCILYGSNIYSQNDITIEITPTCSNQNNGVVEAAVVTEDYAPPFDFIWTDALGNDIPPAQIDENQDDGLCAVSGLAAGTYCLTVTSDDGCSASTCDIVVEALPTPVISSINAICICPGSYGALNVEVTGGSGNYGYAWSGPGTISNPTLPNPTVNAIGIYTVTVTDSQSGCTATAQATVTECDVDISSIVQVTPDCNEEGTSTISIQLPPGYGLAPFEFKWVKLGFGLLETDNSTDGFASLENAEAGEYCLTLRTMNGCDEQVCDIIVTQQPSPNIDFSVTPVSNGSNGAISLNVTGQPGPFSYLWSSGQTIANITGLSAGNYCVTVTDSGSGCTSTTCVPLETCNDLVQALGTLEADVTAIVINSNGTVTLGAINITNVQDQFPGYDFHFHWTGPNGFTASTEDIPGLSSGWYSVNVTSSDCSNLISYGQWEMCGFKLLFGEENANCSTTSIKVSPTPSGTYKYIWDTGEITPSINNAVIGSTHCVTVTVVVNGVEGCSASACYTPAFKPLGVELLNMQAATFDDFNGSIVVNATGGTPNFEYDWSNGMTGASITGLSPGFYTVTVTDVCGNTVSDTYYIQCEFGNHDIQAIVNDISCGTNDAGSIELTGLPNVGTPNPHFNFEWSNGATTQNISGLLAGDYCVSITELTTGCYAVQCFTVGISGTSNFTVSFDLDPGCYPLNEGSITAIPSNPNLGPFNYAWSTWYWGPPMNYGNTPTITNVPAGWYGVVVTDAVGCTASNYTLMWPAPPTFTVQTIDQNGVPFTGPILICPGQTATAQLQVSGAVPVSYAWTNYSQYPLTTITTTVGSLSNMAPGSWAVSVTADDGCQVVYNINVRLATSRLFSTIEPECNTGTSILLTPTGYGPFTYLWSDGVTTKDRTGLIFGNYCVTVTNAVGCTLERCFDIQLPTNFVSGVNVTDTGCGTCIASIDITVNTSNPVSYIWSNGATSQDITGLCEGDYTVTVTLNNCEQVYSYPVTVNGVLDCANVVGPLYQPGTGDGSDFYVLKYFTLKAIEVNCFDAECTIFDPTCSKIQIDPEDNISDPNNCWTGTVTIRACLGI